MGTLFNPIARMYDSVSAKFAKIITSAPASSDEGLVVREVNRAVFSSPADQPATYSAIAHNLVIASSGTDFFTITNPASSGKIIRVIEFGVSGYQTSVSAENFHIVKRSSVNSGGTSTTKTNVPHDSTDAAAVATVLAYTANPTLGTSVGTIRDFWKSINRTNDTATGEYIVKFGESGVRPVVLRESEVLALNYVSQTSTGNNFCCYVMWTEATT